MDILGWIISGAALVVSVTALAIALQARRGQR
jgi:hypothetical protein